MDEHGSNRLVRDGSQSRIPLVAFSITPWEGMWRPRREYVGALSERGWPCLYTSGPLSVWDALKGDPDWKRAPWLGTMRTVDHVMVDRSGKLPPGWPGRKVDRLVLRWHSARIRRALGLGRGDDFIAVAFHPLFWRNIEALEPRHIVYFQYDAHSKMPGWSPLERRSEESLVRRADLIVSASRGMANTLPGDGPAHAQVIPNGVRLEAFAGAQSLPCPDDLARIPRPRIGHVGSISHRLDLETVLAVARSRPDWQFVFIGSVQREGGTGDIAEPSANRQWQQLRALPNFHYLPPKPHEAIPAYMGHMDVNALWYRTSGDGWWLHVSPIKLYENLAVGRPIVATDLENIRQYAEVLDIASGPAQWIEALQRAIDGRGVGTAESRRAVASRNTWDQRVDRLEALLFRMLQASGQRSAAGYP